MGVQNGGSGGHHLAHAGKVFLCAGQVALPEQRIQCGNVVGELMGQAALCRVGLHESFCALLFQRGLKVRRLPLHHLIVEHLHDGQVHQHRNGQAHRQHQVQQSGHAAVGGDHDEDVQQHHDAREKAHQQCLQRVQRTAVVPPAQKACYQNAHQQN